MKSLLVLGVVLSLVARSFATEQTYGSGFEPKPPVPFPAAYKDYQILPDTISPDQGYAFIYPKRSRLYELEEYSLFLATLSPFRILSRIPTGNSNLAVNARCYYAASWTKDSTAAVFVAGSRWGPEKVWLLQLRDGNVAKRTDLTAAVRQQLLPDFQKSRAERYNANYDFVFYDKGVWDFDDAGHVLIDCTCTTDPKELDAHRWAVHFKGRWDTPKGRFIQKDFTRIPAGPNHTSEVVRQTFWVKLLVVGSGGFWEMEFEFGSQG